jgi:sterol 3beta-glucosyltransferase
MRIAFLTSGSRGDIQPMVAVAMELCRRGHTVTLTTNRNLVEWIGERPFEVLPSPIDSEEYLRSPEGQEMLQKGKLTELFEELNRLELNANDAIVDVLVRAATGADVVLSTALTRFRGLSLAEKFRIPHIPLYLQPIVPTCEFPHFALPFESLWLGAFNRWSYDLVSSQIWRSLEPTINTMRATLELPLWESVPRLEQHCNSISLYSKEIVNRPVDWDHRHQLAGFAALKPEDRLQLPETTIPEDLDTWLNVGEPPIFFGFGSMPVLQPHKVLNDIEAVCNRLGTRGLIGSGWTDYGQSTRNDTIFIVKTIDHEQVLPRCRAAVHHGGAGTTHTALRSELPSLVCSFFVDQPFWGRCLKRLGVGNTLPFKKLSLRAMAHLLPPLLQEDTKARAARIGARLRREDGASRTVDLIEAQVSI